MNTLQSRDTNIDPITFEVIRHKLEAITEEQAITLKNVSGSPVVTEANKAAGLHSAMFVIPMVSITLTLVLYLASRTVTKDMEALEQWMHSHKA